MYTALRAGDSYGLLLALLVFSYIAFSVSSGGGNRVVFAVTSVAVLMLAIHTSQVDRRWYHWAIPAGLVVIGIAAIDVSGVDTGRTVEAAAALSAAFLLLGAPVAVISRILGHRRVSFETILGAVCVYLLIGFIFAAAYATIEAVSGTGFFAQIEDRADRDDLLYYSFTVLTTLGFGDLTAATQFGRAFSVLEAVIGQIFLVTLVARLVGLFGLPARQGPVNED
ncbi:MAG: potassium channel family protein [Miltoncostaeaceae bacterium]